METSIWGTQLEVLVLQAQQAELKAATQRVSSLQAQLSASNEAAESAQEASAESPYSETLQFHRQLTKAEESANSAVNRLQRLLKGAPSSTEAAQSEVPKESRMLQLQLLEAARNRDAAEQEVIRLQSQSTQLQAAAEELQRVHEAELAAQVLYNNIVYPIFMLLLQMTLQPV